MTGWIIFGSILLVLIFVFTRPVKVTAVYDSNPEIRVKILCFTIVKVPADEKAKRKKAAKQRKKAEKERKKAEKEARKAAKKNRGAQNVTAAETTSGESADNGESGAQNVQSEAGGGEDAKKSGAKKKEKVKKPKKKLPDLDFDMIKDYVASASPPVKRLFKKIRIRDVYIDWVVGSNDAAVTALKYGGVCAAIYPAVEWIRTYFDMKVKEINVEADFSAEKDDIFAYVTLKLRICTAIGCALWLAVRMLKTYLKYNPTTGAKHKPKTRPVRVKAR